MLASFTQRDATTRLETIPINLNSSTQEEHKEFASDIKRSRNFIRCVMPNNRKGWSMKQRQKNFFSVCALCISCCCQNARPPITQKRRKLIEDYRLAQGLSKDKSFDTTEYVFPRETGDGFCVFFDAETRKCQIYSVKPETCVAGPITFDINLQTGKIEFYLKFERICPLAGSLKKDQVALKKHLTSAKRELLTLVGELDSEALSAILQIDEPETCKIGEASLSKDVLERQRNIHTRRKSVIHESK